MAGSAVCLFQGTADQVHRNLAEARAHASFAELCTVGPHTVLLYALNHYSSNTIAVILSRLRKFAPLCVENTGDLFTHVSS